MADDIVTLRNSYVLSLVERISELEAEVERLREALTDARSELAWLESQEARRGLPTPWVTQPNV